MSGKDQQAPQETSLLDEVLARVVETAHPVRVVLFGSQAQGRARPGSDLDLLVVVRDGVHRRRTAQAIYRRLAGLGQPVDVVVVTERDVELYRDAVGMVIGPALEHGRTVYAA